MLKRPLEYLKSLKEDLTALLQGSIFLPLLPETVRIEFAISYASKQSLNLKVDVLQNIW